MTITPDQEPAATQLSVLEPDVLPYDDTALCPICSQRVDDIGTPAVPVEFLADPAAVDGDQAPVYAYVCGRHRGRDVVLPLPMALAPDVAVGLSARVEGETRPVAVPEPEVHR
ncbi:hypothetical protein [Haloarcula halophila]|uniref:hypothetical protein n=1 Tax=Haloarcula TaxID=2237 RepID=UPI0023E41210|nr:hypothetical protein [Halomicroarcula sp. DFY41]